MNFIVLFILIVIAPPHSTFGGFGKESKKINSFEDNVSSPKTDSCPARVLGGIQWIMHVRQSDYGWKENTHRAIIALAVSDWNTFVKENERKLMEQQLEVEISKALLRNDSSPIYPNNLALFIHGLIATNRNPRDFHGINLVARLLDLMDNSKHTAHPFLLLAVCNSKAINRYHLDVLEYYLRTPYDTRQNLEYKALALQAYECAKTLQHEVNESIIQATQSYLARQQYSDGSFGNVYTTALIVQALASASPYIEWDKEGAIDYLKEQSFIDVNMVSTYLIALALNCERVRFIKDIYPALNMDLPVVKSRSHNFIQYSLRVGSHPDVHHTISINVPPNSNFFHIMKMCAEHDPKYNFSYYLDKNEIPAVYSISNIPNDAEENLYWRLCLQSDVDHNRHISNFSTIHYSPIRLIPKMNEHVIYWYKDSDCEESS